MAKIALPPKLPGIQYSIGLFFIWKCQQLLTNLEPDGYCVIVPDFFFFRSNKKCRSLKSYILSQVSKQKNILTPQRCKHRTNSKVLCKQNTAKWINAEMIWTYLHTGIHCLGKILGRQSDGQIQHQKAQQMIGHDKHRPLSVMWWE